MNNCTQFQREKAVEMLKSFLYILYPGEGEERLESLINKDGLFIHFPYFRGANCIEEPLYLEMKRFFERNIKHV